MSLGSSIDSLRCRLCRNCLLHEYEVYSRQTDPFGAPAQPALYAFTKGYFYFKNKRHYAGILEIAGNIHSKNNYDARLLQFDRNASVGDLILIDGTFYRAASVREITPLCRIIDLEVEPIENSH